MSPKQKLCQYYLTQPSRFWDTGREEHANTPPGSQSTSIIRSMDAGCGGDAGLTCSTIRLRWRVAAGS